MELQLYNSYSKEKEVFKPIMAGNVGLYTCGPTVYDFAHIGNFRTFQLSIHVLILISTEKWKNEKF